MDYAPLPLIDLSGSPRECGRMHGKAAADRRRRGVKMYAEALLKNGVDWKELEHRAERLVPRDKRVREHLGRKLGDGPGKLTLEDFRAAFFDDWNAPWSVCRPPRPNNRGNLVATSAMILMRPGEGHLEGCPMPALNKRFTTYTLAPDRTAQRQAGQKQAAE
jgi:hypothetical protein